MEISNGGNARTWLAAWNWAPRAGILRATIDGLAISYAIAWSKQHYGLAQAYAEAIDALERVA